MFQLIPLNQPNKVLEAIKSEASTLILNGSVDDWERFIRKLSQIDI